MLNVEETKAVALVVLVVVTFIMSLLPLYLRRVLKGFMQTTPGQLFMTGCLCFGAGVLLSIVFLHLLPETRATMDYAMEAGYLPDTHYPLAEVVLVAGFFIIYFVEEIIHSAIHRAHHNHHHRPNTHSDVEVAPTDRKDSRAQITTGPEAVGGHGSVRGMAVLMAEGRTNEAFDGDGCIGPRAEGDTQRVHTIPQAHTPVVDRYVSVIGAVVVVVALSFHGVMEGLALGLEGEVNDVWILTAALASHKVFIAFSMAAELLEEGVSLGPFLAAMIVFSLASPLGGLLGALLVAYINEETAAGVLVPTFLQAVSGGTILYVAFCEVLERERAKPKGGLVKFVTLMMGFSVMAGLEAIGGHEHGHGGHDHDHDHDQTTVYSLTTPTPFAP